MRTLGSDARLMAHARGARGGSSAVTRPSRLKSITRSTQSGEGRRPLVLLHAAAHHRDSFASSSPRSKARQVMVSSSRDTANRGRGPSFSFVQSAEDAVALLQPARREGRLPGYSNGGHIALGSRSGIPRWFARSS